MGTLIRSGLLLLLGAVFLGLPAHAVAQEEDNGHDMGGMDPGDDDEDDGDFDDDDDDDDFDDLIGPAGAVLLNPQVGLASVQIRTSLEGGTFMNGDVEPVAYPTQVRVRDLLLLEEWPTVVEIPVEALALVDALVYPGNGAAAAEASILARNAAGLLREPWRVRAAAAAFNDFVRASSMDFLAAPPEEFLAIREVLMTLAEAASPGDQSGASR